MFKQILRLYETKQYKKALKAAEAILKKSPQHGETLAMKGLIFSQMKRQEEAHALVKKGLSFNLNSHVCWHVSGLLYRAEQNYDQAIKCFDHRTQLLTFDGNTHSWRTLEQIREGEAEEDEGRTGPSSEGARRKRRKGEECQSLLIATYNEAEDSLEYWPMSTPVIVRDGVHQMVNFQQEKANIHLSVTLDHTMFVQRGREEGEEEGQRSPFQRVEAGELVSSEADGRVVRFLGQANRGLVVEGTGAAQRKHQSTLNALTDSLGLSTEELLLAFFECYGAWLAGGGGCMEYPPHSTGEVDTVLTIPTRSEADARYIDSVLTRLAPVLSEGPFGWQRARRYTGEATEEEERGVSEAEDCSVVFLIFDQRWCRLLREQRGPSTAEAQEETRNGDSLYRRDSDSDSDGDSDSDSGSDIACEATSELSSSSFSSCSDFVSLASTEVDEEAKQTASDAEKLSNDEFDGELRDVPSLSSSSLPESFDWSWLHYCSQQYLRAILRGYRPLAGTGEEEEMEGQSGLFTSSVAWRDELLILCLHAGYSAYFERRGGEEERCEEGQWVIWYEDMRSTRSRRLQLNCSRDVSQRQVEGRVWCVTVPPHHLVLARSVLRVSAEGEVLAASRPVIVGQCYQNALKKDPNNLQILKDLSQLQIQRRNADGFRETRRKILLLKTNNRNNWSAHTPHTAGEHRHGTRPALVTLTPSPTVLSCAVLWH